KMSAPWCKVRLRSLLLFTNRRANQIRGAGDRDRSAPHPVPGPGRPLYRSTPMPAPGASVDKVLLDGLRRARKAAADRPYFFALVIKGAADGALIVSKKKCRPARHRA